MDFELEGFDDDFGNLDDRLNEGKAHVTIQDAQEDEINGKTVIKVDFEVVEHEKGGQIGKTGQETFWLTEKSRGRFLRLFLETRATNRAELARLKKQGVAFQANADSLVGKSLVVRLKKNRDGYINWDFMDFYDPASPEANEYPKNPGFINNDEAAGAVANDVDF